MRLNLKLPNRYFIIHFNSNHFSDITEDVPNDYFHVDNFLFNTGNLK